MQARRLDPLSPPKKTGNEQDTENRRCAISWREKPRTVSGCLCQCVALMCRRWKWGIMLKSESQSASGWGLDLCGCQVGKFVCVRAQDVMIARRSKGEDTNRQQAKNKDRATVGKPPGREV